ncbi:MAG: HPr-rel-A system PqqD family peptide chaperone [Gammaproteobacteria bacterium]|jgi:PqqD family protein of HPr-rel-A system
MWRIWDDAVVVFEPLSGDTHRFEGPAGRIFTLLNDADRSQLELETALDSVSDREKIAEVLKLLLAMELLEPA